MKILNLFAIFVLVLTACSTTQLPTTEPTVSPTLVSTATLVSTPTLEPTETPVYNPTGKYDNPGDYIHQMTVDGFDRVFLVHIPTDFVPGETVPLVINLHGRGSSAFDQEDRSQMNVKADAEGFVVAVPQALDNPAMWWGAVPRPMGDPDRNFIRAMLVELQSEIKIDPARVFATGLSNGGAFSNNLGCTFSDMIVGIAPVSGGQALPDICYPERPVSVLAIHGTEDHVIPYDGDYSYGDQRDTEAVHVWVKAWSKRNGCDVDPLTEEPNPTILIETWTNCHEGVEVVLITIEGGGHTWPTTRYGTDFGETILYLDATDEIWEFFKNHPRP